MRTWIPALVLGATLGLLLLFFGGGHDLPTTRCWALAGIALACAATAIALRPRQFIPDVWVVVVVIAVPVVIGLLQIAPLGWHHPWLTPDLALLGISYNHWSLDAQQTWRALGFAVAWGAVAVVVAHLARHARAPRAAQWIVGLVTVHAASAFVIAAFPECWWNTPGNIGRLHGTLGYCNHSAAFWGMTLPLALLVAKKENTWWWWLSAGILAAAVLFTGSRGGILVVTACTAPLLWHLLPQRRRWLWAAATLVAMATWIWLINPTVATSRFGELVKQDASLSNQAETLNGRMLLWRAALPLAATASPLGTGLGTVELVWPRAGSSSFTNSLVDHLHNDHLEWWLESGWIGSVLLLSAGLWALRRTLRAPCSDPHQRALRLGAVLGLSIIVVHGLVDFPWHNESVALHAAVLLGVALAAADAPAQARSTWRLRSGLSLTALALVGATWLLLPWARQDEQALAGLSYLTQRMPAGLSVTGGPVADMDDTTPNTRRAIIFAGHCVLDTRRPRPAPGIPWSFDSGMAWFFYLTESAGRETRDHAWLQAALQRGATIAPSEATLWAHRARMSARIPDQYVQVAPAITRALQLAPTNPAIHLNALSVAASLPPESVAQLIDYLLGAGQPLPAWAWPMAARIIGTDTLAERIWQRRSPLLAQSALPWLARHAEITPYLIALRQTTQLYPEPRQVAVAQELPARMAFGPEAALRMVVPNDADQRAQLACRMVAAGLPVPVALTEHLRQDGPIYLLAATWDPTAPQLGKAAPENVTTQLYRPWLRGLWDQHQNAQAMLAGDGTSLQSNTDGRLIAALVATEPPRTVISTSLRRRALAVQTRQLQAQWNREAGFRWTWLHGGPSVSANSAASAPIMLDHWCAIAIDGEFAGWRKGLVDLAADIGPGPHRLVVFEGF